MASKNSQPKTLKTLKTKSNSLNNSLQNTQPTKKTQPTKSEESAEDTALIRQKQVEWHQVRANTFLSLAFAMFVGIPASLVGGVAVGIFLGLAPPICFMSYRYPRAALWVFLAYMPLGGTVVYWLGGGNPVLQLAKDIFYIPALFGLIQDCRKKRLPIFVPKSLTITLGILIFASLMTLIFANVPREFAPECGSGDFRIFDSSGVPLVYPDGTPVTKLCRSGSPLLQGLMGLKVLLGYVPLIFCGYYLVENRKQLLRFGRLFVSLAILCCGLALIQYFFLKTGRCDGTRFVTGEDIYTAQLGAKCFVGGSLLYSPDYGEIRLPGTFVSPWHWSWFLIGNAAVCFTTAFSETSLFWRILGLVGLGLVQINAIISGQRLAFALVPLMILALTILTGQIVNIKRFIPLGIGLAIVLYIGLSFLNPDFIQRRFDSFVERWNTSSPINFVAQQFEQATDGAVKLFGNGLGRSTNSARVFGPIILIETYHPKLAFEMGFPGLFAFVLFTSHLMILAIKNSWQLRDRYLSSVGKCLAIFLLVITYFPYWYPLDTDPVAIYYWLFAGIIFRLPLIEREEKLVTANSGPVTNERKGLKVAGKPQLKPSTSTLALQLWHLNFGWVNPLIRRND